MWARWALRDKTRDRMGGEGGRGERGGRGGSPASIVKAALAWLAFDYLLLWVGIPAGSLFIYLEDMIVQQISLDSSKDDSINHRLGKKNTISLPLFVMECFKDTRK